MNSDDTQARRTLARVGSAEAERFLEELANLEPGEAAWGRFQRSFSEMLPPRKQAFQAAAGEPYRVRQAARSDPGSQASDRVREERAAKRVGAVLASHKYAPQDTTLDTSSTLETPPPPASRTISADPDGTTPTDPLRRRITDAEQELEWIWSLRQALRCVWDQPDPRTREWGAFLLRLQTYAAADFRHLTTLGLSGPLPPPTAFEQALLHLIRAADRARHCQNPECPAPYFFAKRRSQKYCADKCAEPAQKEFKRRWWAEHGAERRKQTTQSQRRRKKSVKGR